MDNPLDLRPVLASDLIRTVGEPPSPLIEGILPDYALIALTGKPKMGKTFLSFDIAESVVNGDALFGEYAINRPGPVLYLALEESKFEIVRKLRQRGWSENDQRGFYLCHDAITFNSPEAMAWLEHTAKELNLSLVVLDTAGEGLGLRSWNNRAEIIETLSPLRRFAQNVCPVLLVAHNVKGKASGGDEIAGSNAFTGALDGWLSVQEATTLDSGDLRMHLQLAGRNMKGSLAVEMDTETLKFRKANVAAIADEKRNAERFAKLVAQVERFRAIAVAIQKCGGSATVMELSNRTSYSHKTSQILVREMRERGLLEQAGLSGPKNNIPTWKLTPEMDEWAQANRDGDFDYEATSKMFSDWADGDEQDEEPEE